MEDKDDGVRSLMNVTDVTGLNGRNDGKIAAASVSYNMNVPNYRSNVSLISDKTSMQNAEMNALIEE